MITWEQLPASLREIVQGHIGLVTSAKAITEGSNSDVATVLYRDDEPLVFLKAVDGVSPRMRWLRNEVTAAPLAAGLAPAVRFAEDTDSADGRWLLVGFEHLTGRSASLTPGSPDLPLVAGAVNTLGSLPGSGLRPLRQRWDVADWWARFAEAAPEHAAGWDVQEALAFSARLPELADGDRLTHTDLHGDQFLIDGQQVRVIDWGYPGCGAPWVDTAFMVLRLIEAGHEVADAEAWARAHLQHMPDDEQLTAFAVYIAGLWSYWTVSGNVSSSQSRARLARDYATWRAQRGLALG